ncbi:hypothetical protein AO265_18470 [Pseudomonas sp. ABAC61]|nr:hypothetical protein AO265_18470 [Pseudomonas sp. ABAC61]
MIFPKAERGTTRAMSKKGRKLMPAAARVQTRDTQESLAETVTITAKPRVCAVYPTEPDEAATI